MSNKCAYPPCGRLVPKEREQKSDCCCNDCSYAVKKLKQKKTYRSNRKIILKDRKLEKMLADSYRYLEAGVTLTGAHLYNMGFEMGYFTSLTSIDDNIVAKVIGDYAYYIDSNDKLTIWKSNSLL